MARAVLTQDLRTIGIELLRVLIAQVAMELHFHRLDGQSPCLSLAYMCSVQIGVDEEKGLMV